jgi:hypothetical protein
MIFPFKVVSTELASLLPVHQSFGLTAQYYTNMLKNSVLVLFAACWRTGFYLPLRLVEANLARQANSRPDLHPGGCCAAKTRDGFAVGISAC